jgi:hypothetical protein
MQRFVIPEVGLHMEGVPACCHVHDTGLLTIAEAVVV